MFQQVQLSLLLGAVRSLSVRQLHLPGVQSVLESIANLPCLHCGLQKSLALTQSTTNSDFFAEHKDCGRMRLPLSCSSECADKIETTQSDTLTLYESIVEDVEYAATPDASMLLSKVLQSNQRGRRRWEDRNQLTSWTDYLKLNCLDGRWLKDQRALRLLSSAYSYVMTLSRYLPTLIDMNGLDGRQHVELHVIGARAEAMMPHYLWNELSYFYPGRYFDIKLVGDHMPTMPVSKKTFTTTVSESASIQLEMVNNLYHKIEPRKLGTPDAFILYNPGIGHPRLQKKWEATLQAVLVSCKPVLITSFSPDDQQRDIAALHDLVANSPTLKEHELQFRCQAKLNSFRSLKFQIDPSNVRTPILTNNRVMVVQLASIAEKFVEFMTNDIGTNP